MTWNPQLLRLEILSLFAPLCRYQLWSDKAIERQERLRRARLDHFNENLRKWRRDNHDHVLAYHRQYAAERLSDPALYRHKLDKDQASLTRRRKIKWQEETRYCPNCNNPFRRDFKPGAPARYCSKRCKKQYVYRTQVAPARAAKKAGKA